MFAATHKLIARNVYEYIEREVGISLDRKAFIFGSIAPDVKLSMRVIKHNRKGSFELVRHIGNSLLEINVKPNKMNLKEYSYRLGIIMHFLCDYFCKAHNEIKYRNNIIAHLFYENNLEKYAFKHTFWSYPGLDEIINNCLWRDGNFEEIIKSKTLEYYSKRSSISRDMEFAITVSTMVALNIVKKTLATAEADGIGLNNIRLLPAIDLA